MKVDNPTLRRQVLGEQLRALRTKAGFTQEEAAWVIKCSGSNLSRVESGHRGASIEDVVGLLWMYGANSPQRSYVLALARDADELGWLQSKDLAAACGQHALNSLEPRAEQIVSFDPILMPRLLQTSQYRSAVLAASATVPSGDIDDDRHTVGAHRQPPQMLAFVDEWVLHRPVGGLEVLRRQLAHLREVTAESRWPVRVLPRDQAIASGPFTVVRLPDRPPVVVVDHLTCWLFLESPQDINAYEDALKHLDEKALSEAESRELISDAAAGLGT